MPEAIARSSSGSKASRRPALPFQLLAMSVIGNAAGAALRFLARRISRRPVATIAGAAFAALMAGVALNGLVFQKARHPAGLMDASADAAGPGPAAPPPVPVPVQRGAARQPPAPAEQVPQPPQDVGQRAGGPQEAPPADAITQSLEGTPASGKPDARPAARPPPRGKGAASAGKPGHAKGADKISQFLNSAGGDAKPRHHRRPKNED